MSTTEHSKAQLEAAIEETRRRLHPQLRWFDYGDLIDTEELDICAIKCLDQVKDQMPDWAYKRLVGLAMEAASKRKRKGRGERTSFHSRNLTLATEADRLTATPFRFKHTVAQYIIREALVRLGHRRMTVDAIKSGIRRGKQLQSYQ
jgi:hypothetical protein